MLYKIKQDPRQRRQFVLLFVFMKEDDKLIVSISLNFVSILPFHVCFQHVTIYKFEEKSQVIYNKWNSYVYDHVYH